MVTTLEKKIKQLSKILENRPGDELTMLALAEASFRRGFRLEALTAYQEIVTNHPVPEAYLAVAEIYANQSMFQEAYGELTHLFELDPNNVEARLLVNELSLDSLPPEDIQAIMGTQTSEVAFENTRLRLKIKRSIYHRELQERTRNATLEPGTVMHEYHMEEAKRKLIKIDELLQQLAILQQRNQELQLAIPRPKLVAPSDPQAASDQDMPPLDSFEAFEEAANTSVVNDTPEIEMPLETQFNADTTEQTPTASESPSLITSKPDIDSTTSVQALDDEGGRNYEDNEFSDEVISETTSTPPREVAPAPAQTESDDSEDRGTHPEPASLDLNLGIAQIQTSAAIQPISQGFPSEFSISLDSPIAPDLPDLSPAALDTDPEPLQNQDEVYSPEEESTAYESQEDLGHQLDSSTMDKTPSPYAEQDSLSESKLAYEPTDPDEAPSITERPFQLEIQLEDGTDHSQQLKYDPTRGKVDSSYEPDPSTPEFAEPSFNATPAVLEPDSADTEADTPTNSTGAEEPSGIPIEHARIVIEDSTLTDELSLGHLGIDKLDPLPSSPQTNGPDKISPARKAFYQLHSESISSLTSTLARTRGVTSIFLAAREGVAINSSAKDHISQERIGELVKESFEFLEAFASDLSYWVLECSGGIFVMQRLDDLHVLIAVGQAGANFGALRYTMDKTKIKFEQLLAQAPK